MKNLLKYFKDLSIHPKNAAELKGLILQLAVEGKLTANWRLENPKVEPASVLLERIQIQKAQLVKEGKIKKEKPLPEITEDEIPFELPSSWAWSRLGDYIHNFGQKTPDQYFEYIDVASIDNVKGVIQNNLNVLDANEAPSRARKIVKKGCVIYSTVRPYLLNIAVVDRDFKHEAIASTAFAILNPLLGCSKTYLYHLLRSNFFIDYVESCMKGVAYPAINDGNLLQGIIPIPPLEEQKAIVSVVNQLFAEVDQLEALTKERIRLKEDFVQSALKRLSEMPASGVQTHGRASQQTINGEWAFLKQHFPTFFTEQSNIKKLRESILQLAVQGKLTTHWRSRHPELVSGSHSAKALLERIKAEKAQLIKEGKIKKEKPLLEITADEIPYELPEGWVWCRFIQIGIINPRNQAQDSMEIGFVPMKDISQTYSIKPNFEVRKWKDVKSGFTHFMAGDIAFAKITPCFENSKACVFNELPNSIGAGTTELHVFRPITNDIESKFIYCIFKSPHFLNEGEIKMTGSAGQKRVPKSYFEDYLVGLPPVEEQQAIVEKVNTLMALCDRLEQEIQNSKATQEDWMKSSLREVFSEAKPKAETKVMDLDRGELGMVAEPESKYKTS